MGQRHVGFGASAVDVLARLERELDEARTALWECARICDEDLEDDTYHVLKHPSVEQFAVEAVQRMRNEYDELLGDAPW